MELQEEAGLADSAVNRDFDELLAVAGQADVALVGAEEAQLAVFALVEDHGEELPALSHPANAI